MTFYWLLNFLIKMNGVSAHAQETGVCFIKTSKTNWIITFSFEEILTANRLVAEKNEFNSGQNFTRQKIETVKLFIQMDEQTKIWNRRWKVFSCHPNFFLKQTLHFALGKIKVEFHSEFSPKCVCGHTAVYVHICIYLSFSRVLIRYMYICSYIDIAVLHSEWERECVKWVYWLDLFM